MEAIIDAEIRYGTIILWKLIPDAKVAMISELSAIFDVKNITAMNVNNGLNRLA
jgi:hypothetical protein